MAANSTAVFSALTERPPSVHLHDDLADKLYPVFRYALLPCTSVLGIVGNVTSIIILTRQGFQKSSNILLLALAVSDVLFLIGINNIPMYIYVTNNPQGFQFSAPINYLFYILSLAFFCAYTFGFQCGMIIPSLITGERIVAIACPFKAYFILTPRRTIIAVSTLYFVNALFFLYQYTVCRQFKQIVVGGVAIGGLLFTDVYRHDVRTGQYALIRSIVNYLTGVVPISIVAVGCVVIATMVAVSTNRRKQLTCSQVKLTTKTFASKTTKTLLSICVCYVVCSGFAFVIEYVTTVKPFDQDMPLKNVLGSVQDLLLAINCVGNFIIYVGANRSFKKTRPKKLALKK